MLKVQRLKSTADLAFLLKPQARNLKQHIYPVFNSRGAIDHTFMTISFNLADFTDFFLPETLTSSPLRFTPFTD